MQITRHVTCQLVLAVLLWSGAGCTYGGWGPKVSETRTFTVPHDADAALRVESRNGSVHIEVDPALETAAVEAIVTCRGATEDEARQRLADTVVDVVTGGGETTLRPVFPGAPRDGDGMRFLIRVPGATAVVVRSSNGSVSVTGIAGGADVQTSNGSVELTDLGGPCVARTSNGRVTVTGANGPVELRTSNGRVTATDVPGATIATSNGRVELRLSPEGTGPLSVTTSNGRVTVFVGDALDGTVSMSTSNGRVSLHDAGNRATASSISKTRGTVTLGAGGPESRITSSNGNVTLTVGE